MCFVVGGLVVEYFGNGCVEECVIVEWVGFENGGGFLIVGGCFGVFVG